jgi:hypothetical protein
VSHLGDFFKSRRQEMGLNLGQLTRLLGYQNLSRGCNKIKAFEAGGKVHPDLLARLAVVLEVSPDEIRGCVAEIYKDWLAWANEPIRPYVVVRLMACVYQRVQLPEDALDPEGAEAFASDVARVRKSRAWLVLSRRVSVEFDVEGMRRGSLEATTQMPCEPYATIGGQRVQFDFDDGDVGLWPIDDPGR